MQCPKCNRELPEGFENCPNCNTNIYETENVMPCPRCYKRIDKSAKFCPFCGEKLESVQIKNYEPNAPMSKYETLLKDKDKFIKINDADFVVMDYTIFYGIVGAVIGVVWAFIANDTNGFFFPFVLVFKVMVGFIVFCIVGYSITSSSNVDKEKKIKKLKSKVVAHNITVFNKYKKERLAFYNIKKVSKEIRIDACDFGYTGVLIDEENKTFSYISIGMSKTGGKSCTVHQANYSEILRYSFLDKSTSTQVATSTTSSNSGKALGGAIASQVLIGNATAGAVIGGSGQRTTETTYKTKVNNKYQITIYLNRLQDSVLTINLTSGNTTNEIISTLEYILNTNKG